MLLSEEEEVGTMFFRYMANKEASAYLKLVLDGNLPDETREQYQKEYDRLVSDIQTADNLVATLSDPTESIILRGLYMTTPPLLSKEIAEKVKCSPRNVGKIKYRAIKHMAEILNTLK